MKYIICILVAMAGMFFVRAQQTYIGRNGELKLHGPVKGYTDTTRAFLVSGSYETFLVDFDENRAPLRVIEWGEDHKIRSVSHYYNYRLHNNGAIRSYSFLSPDTAMKNITVTPTGVITLSDNPYAGGYTKKEMIYSLDAQGRIVKAEEFRIDTSGRRHIVTQYIKYTATGKIAEERRVAPVDSWLSFYQVCYYDRSDRLLKRITFNNCSKVTTEISLADIDCKGVFEVYEYRSDGTALFYDGDYIPGLQANSPKLLKNTKRMYDKNGNMLEYGKCNEAGVYIEKPGVNTFNKAGQLIQNIYYVYNEAVVQKYQYNSNGDCTQITVNGRVSTYQYQYDRYNNWVKQSHIDEKGKKFYEIIRTFRYGN